MEKRKSCGCLKDCPCYPNCDQMMSDGRMPGAIPPKWLRMEDRAEDWESRRAPRRAEDEQAEWDRMIGPEAGYPGMRMSGGPSRAEMPEEENERDWQKLKELYPDVAKLILAEVESVCDSMEYEGSMMFDSIPDKVRVRRLTGEIYEKMKGRFPVEEMQDQDDMFVMNQESRRRYPPKQNWLSDFIQVLLYQEMFHRRCRHRSCRHW